MAEKSLRERAVELYEPPFVFKYGYVYDAKGMPVCDDKDLGDGVQRVRGWGRISYLPDPEKLQDEIGAIMAEALNAFWEGRVYTAAEHEEVEKLRLGHKRYEKLRRLNVPQFEDLFRRNLKGEASFDSLVDALPKIGGR